MAAGKGAKEEAVKRPICLSNNTLYLHRQLKPVRLHQPLNEALGGAAPPLYRTGYRAHLVDLLILLYTALSESAYSGLYL